MRIRKLFRSPSSLVPALFIGCVLFPFLTTPPVRAAGPAESCRRLAETVTGARARLSVQAQVNGFAAFPDIACAMRIREKELCAMETLAFDSSARVFDFNTGAEIEMLTAVFVVEPDNQTTAPGIAAFKTREDALRQAEKYPGAKVLDYTQLLAMKFR